MTQMSLQRKGVPYETPYQLATAIKENEMREFNSAGQEVYPIYLNPCPVRCNSSGGCEKCRINRQNDNKFSIPVIRLPYKMAEQNDDYTQYEGLTPEEEKQFYDKVHPTQLLS